MWHASITFYLYHHLFLQSLHVTSLLQVKGFRHNLPMASTKVLFRVLWREVLFLMQETKSVGLDCWTDVKGVFCDTFLDFAP